MQINVIARNEKNVVEHLVNLKYNVSKYNDLWDISAYLQKKYNMQCEYYECQYDIECKKEYIYHLAKKNRKLDLNINFYDINFKDYYKITKSEILTVNAVKGEGGMGSVTELFKILEMIMLLWDFLKSIFSLINSLFVIFFPFYNIKKNYGYGKSFLYDILTRSTTWDYGFLNLDKIKFNKALEKSIMRKFGYKKKNGIWVNDIYIDSYSNLNKYDSF